MVQELANRNGVDFHRDNARSYPLGYNAPVILGRTLSNRQFRLARISFNARRPYLTLHLWINAHSDPEKILLIRAGATQSSLFTLEKVQNNFT